MAPPPSIQIQARSEGPDVRCGYCRDEFREDASHSCGSCGTPYHPECWDDELRGHCATIGCREEKPLQGPRRLRRLGTRLRRRYRRRLLDGPTRDPAVGVGKVCVVLALLSLGLVRIQPWMVIVAWILIAALGSLAVVLARRRT